MNVNGPVSGEPRHFVAMTLPAPGGTMQGSSAWGCGAEGGLLVAALRFCAYQYQHLALDALQQRWRDAERLGFDVLWNCDTVVEPDRPRHAMFDGPTTLTMMAAETTAIRVGTLVSSLYFRHPVTLAKAAMTVDHLSGGRLEVALGVGDPSAGAMAAGVDWTPGEQVARFGEFVELVDLLLRQEITSYQGRFYQCEQAETVPLPVQRPRPPITIAAHGPKMLRIAAEHADAWSQWGGYDVETEDDLYAVTNERSRRFDDLCVAAGRDPFTIRHSLVCFPPLTPWESAEYFRDMVGRYAEIGIDEFVLYWPQNWREAPHEDAVFEEVATTVIPELRGAS
jgi:alkanesulfonate monooxygenase SsuD/methylene tetrahydromethanopterin reductase-like flavin-dependent oxidoreductase (luciferase family)